MHLSKRCSAVICYWKVSRRLCGLGMILGPPTPEPAPSGEAFCDNSSAIRTVIYLFWNTGIIYLQQWVAVWTKNYKLHRRIGLCPTLKLTSFNLEERGFRTRYLPKTKQVATVPFACMSLCGQRVKEYLV